MAAKRLVSLDVLRGLTVALMILVNNPGSWAHIHPPLRHAAWHGLTPTDLVFPFFLFAVGAAIALAFGRRRDDGATRGDLLRKVARRTAVIFAIGWLLNGFPFTAPEHWRFWGVLQRIALCYGAVGVAVVLVPGRAGRLAVGIGAVVLYELLMRLPLVDGWGAGSFALADNFARRVDLWWPGADHLHAGAGLPFDPEGLVSTLPAVAGTLVGHAAGRTLAGAGELAVRVRRLLGSGVLLAVAGLGLAPLEPINKQLWTVSYTALTSGLALVLLAACTWVIDVRGVRRGTGPWQAFGSNALLVFVGSGLVARLLVVLRLPGEDGRTVKATLYQEICVPLAGDVNGSLLFALGTVAAWWAVARVLRRKGILLRV